MPEPLSKREVRDDETELLPKPGDEYVGYRIFAILDEVLKDKESRHLPKKWSRNYQLSRNKHWKRKPATKGINLLSANLLFTHRERTVNLLTDNNPTFNVRKLGRSREDQENFQTLVRATEHWWREEEQQSVLEKSVRNGETYGATIEKVHFDPEKEFGLGEVTTDLVDPFHFGVYPVTKTNNQDADANLHYFPMSLREARRMWPDKADEIVADKELLEELGDDRTEMSGSSKMDRGLLTSFQNTVRTLLNDKTKGIGENEEEVLVVECWLKDYTMIREKYPLLETVPDSEGRPVEQPVLDEDGQPLYEVITYPKYPGHIRTVWCCNGGKVVLDDRANPSINPDLPAEMARMTYLFDKFPFNLTQSITDTNDPWGQSDFDQLDSLQVEINKSMSQFTMLKDKAARLKLMNPKNSGVKNEEFDNVPGIINPTNEMVAQGIKYMDPPEIPQDIIKALEVYKDLFFLVAGTFDLDQAKQEGREVIAYKAIAALIERASTMLKGKIRNYGLMIRERGRMYVSHVQNWYTEERWISYDINGEDREQVISGMAMILPAKLTFVSGSTLPISKVQEREEALALFQMGAIDQEELLKKLEWPDWRKVLQRMSLGPLADMLEKMLVLGMPQPLVQYIQQVSRLDDAQFQKALKQNQIPPFTQVLAMAMKKAVPSREEVEVKQLAAEVDKTKAETLLTAEKARSEKVEQEVKRAGVGFDQKKLRMEEAKTIAEIKAQFEQLRLDLDKAILDANTKRETAKSRDNKPAPTKKTANKKGQGPYRERGLKSNNQR